MEPKPCPGPGRFQVIATGENGAPVATRYKKQHMAVDYIQERKAYWIRECGLTAIEGLHGVSLVEFNTDKPGYRPVVTFLLVDLDPPREQP